MKKIYLLCALGMSTLLMGFKLAIPTNGTYGTSQTLVQSQSTVQANLPTWQKTMIAAAQTAIPGQLSLNGFFGADWRAIGLYGWNLSKQDSSREPVSMSGWTPTPNAFGNFTLSLKKRTYPQYKVHKNSAGNYIVFEIHPTGTFTMTRTNTATNTATNTRTMTATCTATRTSTSTATNTSTFVNTWTAVNTSTMTATQTATSTRTMTATQTASSTGTSSPTNTATAHFSFTSTSTMTNTSTQTQTATQTSTVTPTITFTPTLTCTCDVSWTPQCFNQ